MVISIIIKKEEEEEDTVAHDTQSYQQSPCSLLLPRPKSPRPCRAPWMDTRVHPPTQTSVQKITWVLYGRKHFTNQLVCKFYKPVRCNTDSSRPVNQAIHMVFPDASMHYDKLNISSIHSLQA